MSSDEYMQLITYHQMPCYLFNIDKLLSNLFFLEILVPRLGYLLRNSDSIIRFYTYIKLIDSRKSNHVFCKSLKTKC